LAAILIFFIVTVLRHKKKTAEIYEKQINAEINTLETERTRIAADLHDDIGPLLSSVKLQMSCMNTQDEEDIEMIEKLSSYLDDIVQKVRETSNDLMPRVLSTKGLLIAVKDFAADINKTKA